MRTTKEEIKKEIMEHLDNITNEKFINSILKMCMYALEIEKESK